MSHTQPIRSGMDKLYLLLSLVMALAWWQECGAMEPEYICAQPTLPKNCVNVTRVREGECFKFVCILKAGDPCYPNDDTIQCDNGLACICHRCMNCDQSIRKCVMSNCPNYIIYLQKRVQNGLLPWFTRARWQELQQRLLEPTYDD